MTSPTLCNGPTVGSAYCGHKPAFDCSIGAMNPTQASDQREIPSYKQLGQLSSFAHRWLPSLLLTGASSQTDNPLSKWLLSAHLASITPESIRLLWQQVAPKQTLDASAQGAVGKALRQWRNAILIALAERSRAGQAPLSEVLAAVSALASESVQIALQVCEKELIAQYGVPCDSMQKVQDLYVMGMGKLGGNELNVSSDIDLVLLYREQGQCTGDQSGDGKIFASDYFARLTKMLAQLLQTQTEYGFVFRVDLRLRPHGDSGASAVSFGYLEDYLINEGRPWERFAWLKASCIATTSMGQAQQRQQDRASIERIIEPFVYRRYIDFAAIDSLRQLHQTIVQEHQAKTRQRSQGWDVKLGRGGIREIEFTVQLLQILRGGKEPGIREKNTLLAIEKLSLSGALNALDAKTLARAYGLLRVIENALQWRDDAQTHWLTSEPNDASAREQTAALCAMSVQQMDALLEPTRQSVMQIFDSVLGQPSRPDALEPSVPTSPKVISSLQSNRRFQLASEATRTQALRLVGHAQQLSETSLDSNLLNRLVNLLETILGRPGYIAMLGQFPLAFERLCKMLSYSSWASNYINRYPSVLDELLSGQLLEKPNWSTEKQNLVSQLQHCVLPGSVDQPDVERQLDLLRETHHDISLRLLAQEIEGLLTIEQLSDELSALADCLLQVTLNIVAPDHKGLAVIAYGKLGSKEIGYASDLDLIFLYRDQDPQAQDRFAKIARKVCHWLTVPTGAGIVFDVDLRLRPNGEAGLLVSSVDSFEKYQLSQAWVWEHQALTRARFCAGDTTLKDDFDRVRNTILSQYSSPEQHQFLRTEIAQMRGKIHDGHPNKSDLFDLKHDTGGMVDIEFIVQALVLEHAHEFKDLLPNVGNIALLHRCADHQLITTEQADAVANSYREYRREQHRQRLNDQSKARVSATQFVNERASVTHVFNRIVSLA
jgi:[glutamine synthetase] adenylyltransferase / [glutamine synthetase]-adenylyl-L-tyrosine phosphorylase